MELRKLLILILIVISAFCFSYMNASSVSSNYGFDVSITPDVAKQGVFQAKLVISELTSGKIVAAPTIRFRQGQPAEVTAVDIKDGVNFKFSVSVDETGSVAEYSAAVLQSNTEISRSQAKISFGN
jgi:hypothetical protein